VAPVKVRSYIMMVMARATMPMEKVAMAVIHGMMPVMVVIHGTAMTDKVYLVAKEDEMVLQRLGGPGLMMAKVAKDIESEIPTKAP